MRQLCHILKRIEELVAGLAYVLMTAMVGGEVVAREVFQTTIFGSEKIAILASVVAGFVGFALVTHANRHLRISAFDTLVPARLQPIQKRFAELVSALLMAMLAWLAFGYVLDAMAYSEQVEVLYIPRWPFQMVIAYAFASSALQHLAFFIHPEDVPPDEMAALQNEQSETRQQVRGEETL